MLVLTRRQGETIYIGDDIVLRVNEVKGGRVRLGIQAPEDVSIDRVEVFGYKRKQTTPKQAEQGSDIAPCTK